MLFLCFRTRITRVSCLEAEIDTSAESRNCHKRGGRDAPIKINKEGAHGLMPRRRYENALHIFGTSVFSDDNFYYVPFRLRSCYGA